MALERFNNPSIRPFSLNIKSLPGAKFYFYNAGSSTPRIVYQDKFGLVPHSNPVVADSSGFFPPIFLDGLYRVELKDADEVTQSGYPIDNIGNDLQTFPFGPWAETYAYSISDIVYGSDGSWYISLQDGNLGNDPTTEGEWWSRIAFITFWNPDQVYNGPTVVIYDNRLWVAESSGNVGNLPGPGSEIWTDPSSGFTNPMTTIGDIITGGTLGAPVRFPAPTDAGLTALLTYDVDTETFAWEDVDDFAGGGGGTGANVAEVAYVDLGDVAVSGSETVNIDLSLGNRFVCSLESSNTSGTLTFTASNYPAAGAPFEIHLVIRRAGRKSVAFPATWDWNQLTTPTFDGATGRYTKINIAREPFFTSNGAVMTVTTQTPSA